MKRELHVRFCEKLKGWLLWLTRPYSASLLPSSLPCLGPADSPRIHTTRASFDPRLNKCAGRAALCAFAFLASEE